MQIPCRALIALVAVAAALPCATTAGRAAGVDLENLYRTHEWFELRAAVTKERRCRIQRTGAEVSLAIGTLDVLRHPAHVTMQRIALIGGDCCVGNVGRDLLAQRSAIVIDLS